MEQGGAWIDQLPGELAGQQAILRRLVAFSEADPDVCWLVIGCSLARGAADRMSDLDMAIGVREPEFEAVRDRIRAAADGLGDLVDRYQHQIDGLASLHERIFAQYADGCQLDLVVMPADLPSGPLPTNVLLYDADGTTAGEASAGPGNREAADGTAADATSGEAAAGPGAPEPWRLREWAFGGWCALADLSKYVRRGSAWEALDRLNEARSQLWRLHAAASGIKDARYGLTSVLDFAPHDIPAGMEQTVAGLSLPGLLAAARQTARLLTETGQRLPAEAQAALPDPMARYITALLDSIGL